jgi:hypothetical protein
VPIEGIALICFYRLDKEQALQQTQEEEVHRSLHIAEERGLVATFEDMTLCLGPRTKIRVKVLHSIHVGEVSGL